MRRIAAGAVALVCALVLSGCGLQFSLGFGTEKDGRFDGTEITVPVLYASGTKGVLATQRIAAASAEGAGLSIDITENDVSGVDPVTQSATWTAVTAATLLTGARPDTAYTFGFDTRIATPAAGAVTAVGVLALYYGTEILPGVALSGAVTPFGAIRPVPGLAEQVTAAIEAGGVDTILVPAGQRIVRDAQGGTVDLDQLAATGGMTVSEVADIAGAYTVMTGEDLPAEAFPTPAASPSPLPTAPDPGGDGAASDGPLSDARDAAIARASEALDVAVDPTAIAQARSALARADDLRAAGDTVASLAAATTAADAAALGAVPATSTDAATALAEQTLAAAGDLLTDLSAREPASVGEADAVLRAATATAEAYALADYATTSLAAADEPDVARAGTAAALLAASTLETARATDASPGERGTTTLSGGADLDGVASLLRRAGLAAEEAFASRVVAGRAKTDDVSDTVAAAKLAAADPATLRAVALAHARDALAEIVPGDEGWAALGIAVAGYTHAAPALAAAQTVRPPADVDTAGAAARRVAVAAEYTGRAVDVLTATGAEVPFVRGALAEAAASTAIDPPPPSGAAAYSGLFVAARVLAFAAGIERR
ncbi:hypothetical protein [Microbacterium sp.]|uniref:hypothetical protein n=1 Tax=Microbacterium sp. TaxID=51671 RepID=UPI0025E17869|nr:hypothetical protein [Microbacterium sp.]MBT9607552.1 hypothetical protein [Microbacterium sp.]